MTHPAPFLCAPVLATALLLSGSAHADTPPIFPVQGVLTDAEGVAIDGEVSHMLRSRHKQHLSDLSS